MDYTTFEAQFDGTCVVCHQGYFAGTEIERYATGAFAHANGCPPQEEEDVEAWLRRALAIQTGLLRSARETLHHLADTGRLDEFSYQELAAHLDDEALDIDGSTFSTEVSEEPRCTCGFGGFHDDINPRCARNEWVCRADPATWLTTCTSDIKSISTRSHLMAMLGCGWKERS